jgi:hypothetical protein
MTGNCQCKMAGNGIRSFAKLCSQMPRIAKLHAQVARNTCGQVRPVAIRSQMDTSVCGNPQCGYSICAIRGLNAADCHNPRYTFERGA